MKVDTQPFPSVNMVEGRVNDSDRSARRQLDFAFGINMAGLCHITMKGRRRLIPAISPKREKEYIT
jgi:hypothetical protein